MLRDLLAVDEFLGGNNIFFMKLQCGQGQTTWNHSAIGRIYAWDPDESLVGSGRIQECFLS
jgi:hypothetical protein